VIKSRRKRWAGHIARIEERCIQGFWSGNLSERDHLENPGIDRRIILRRIFSKWDVVACTV
jgi:hypothetical protein